MNEHSIFVAALEIAEPGRRAAYLDEACAGDAALRKQVDALLAAHERSGEFLDVPVLKQLAAGRPLDETSAEHSAGHGEIDLSFLEPSTAPGSLGRLRHYEVREVIGRGGCGIVLKAFDEKLQRVVAIKVMAQELATTSPARKRFLREARAAAAIRHENVIGIHAVEDQPLPYLVMECIDGVTLQQKLDQTGPLDLCGVLDIGRQIAGGLAAAHSLGLVHRDIKPGNILLEAAEPAAQSGKASGGAAPRYRVKITDFGLARAADDASLTQSGMIAGTPLYMSPEQAQGAAIDSRSDLFSLGGVLYVMCSGRPPFRAPTTLAVLMRVAREEPRPIQEIIPEVPDWLVAIIARLHAKNRDERFASAQELADLLARCLAELEQHGRVESSHDLVARLPRPSQDTAEQGVDGARAARGQAEQRAPRAPAIRRARPHGRRWAAAAAILVALFAGLGMTEATGVTNVRGTVIRLFSPGGTLVVEVDDPGVSVTIDGEDMVITGAGAKEIRLSPGQYKVLASKDGEVVRQELVTVTKNGRQVVRVSREATDRDEPAPTGQIVADPDRKARIESGSWKVEGEELVHTDAVRGNCRIFFGDPAWTDYDYSFDVVKTAGAFGAATMFRARDPDNWLLFDLAGWQNRYYTVESLVDKKFSWIHRDRRGAMFKDRLYRVLVKVRGTRYQCFVDDVLIYDFADNRHPQGAVGLRCWGGAVRVSNIRVRSPDGQVLWQGPPDLPATEPADDSSTAVPSANEQAAKVRDELRRRNPDFKGVIAYDIEEGQIVGCKVAGGEVPDLSPLAALADLRQLDYEALDPMRDAPVLREMESLETINGYSAATFRLAYPASKPAGGVDAAWLEAVGKLPAETRLEVVVKKLKELNPNYDGRVGRNIEEGRITSLRFVSCDALTDLSPLRAFKHLQSLHIGSLRGRGWLSDVSPLQGMALNELSLLNQQVGDLAPLKGMPLTSLQLIGLPVADLSPLAGTPLKRLDIFITAVSDLAPLEDAPLEHLNCNDTSVSDLSPLAGMPLKSLWFSRTRVTDLSPLEGMQLTSLTFAQTRVSDLSPLKGMPLTGLGFTQALVTDLSPLEGMPLENLGIAQNRISDLSPLKGMPLTWLWCNLTRVEDLSPLEGMRLRHLQCWDTRVSDLSPLKGMPLESLSIPDVSAENLEIVRGIESLKKINDKSAAQFWKEIDARESM